MKTILINNEEHEECIECQGDGSVSTNDRWNAYQEVWEPDYEPCNACHGEGWVKVMEENERKKR